MIIHRDFRNDKCPCGRSWSECPWDVFGDSPCPVLIEQGMARIKWAVDKIEKELAASRSRPPRSGVQE